MGWVTAANNNRCAENRTSGWASSAITLTSAQPESRLPTSSFNSVIRVCFASASDSVRIRLQSCSTWARTDASAAVSCTASAEEPPEGSSGAADPPPPWDSAPDNVGGNGGGADIVTTNGPVRASENVRGVPRRARTAHSCLDRNDVSHICCMYVIESIQAWRVAPACVAGESARESVCGRFLACLPRLGDMVQELCPLLRSL